MVNDQYTFRQSYPVTATPMRKRKAENIRRRVIPAGKSSCHPCLFSNQKIVFTLHPDQILYTPVRKFRNTFLRKFLKSTGSLGRNDLGIFKSPINQCGREQKGKFLGRHIGGEMILGLPLEKFSPLKFSIFSS